MTDIKITSLPGTVFARQISLDEGVLERVMFLWRRFERSRPSNLWAVHDGKVLRPPKDNLVLEDVCIGLLEEMYQTKHIPFELRLILKSEVLQAAGLLLTSATKEVLAITTLDGQPVGHGLSKGTPGPSTKRCLRTTNKPLSS
jgi:D-alanine transaminase